MAVVFLTAAMPAIAKQPFVEGDKLNFRLSNLDGETVGSDDPRFSGKVLLVDLWATWCPPCLSEIPTLIELQKEYGDRGLVVVAIAFEGEDDESSRRARLRQFVEDRGVNYIVLDGGRPEDFESALPDVKQVRGFPVEIVIDRNGAVVDARNSYGFKKNWARDLEKELAELLGETDD